MSRVYFRSLSGTAELRGSERAWLGQLINRITDGILDLRGFGNEEDRIRELIRPGHHLATAKSDPWWASSTDHGRPRHPGIGGVVMTDLPTPEKPCPDGDTHPAHEWDDLEGDTWNCPGELDEATRKAVAGIPGSEGWWKSGDEVYEGLAARLIGHGMSPEEAVDILESAYWAAAGEYGD